jgi:DNA polymerase III alpha subunit
LELDKKENPEKYEETSKEEKDEKKKEKKKWYNDEICQVVWVITEYRKIFTKTGKPMIFLKCEWYDYEFEVVIFSKDVEKYEEKIDNYKIVIVNWNLDINLEYSRKSVRPRDLKIATITQVREQAKDMWLFDENIKKFRNNDLNQVELLEEENNEKCNNKCEVYSENFEENLEKKINDNLNEFVINIPSNAKKQDLVDLKGFLDDEEVWNIEIFINLKWQKITTKKKIKNLNNLNTWIYRKWS